MKKLLAVLVMLAMIAAVSFAEASVSGSIGLGAKVMQGNSSGEDGAAFSTALNAHWISASFSWQEDEGKAGAKIKINGDMGLPTGGPKFNGRIWWKPLSFLKVDIFQMEDEGVFGRGNAIDWGYQANSSAGNITALWAAGWNSFSNATLRSGTGFFGGTGNGPEIALSLYPLSGLSINYALPLGGEGKFIDWLKNSIAQVTYDLSGIGGIAVSFKGNTDYSGLIGWRGGITAQTLAVDFNLSMLKGMGIEIGAKIPLGGKITLADWYKEEKVSLPIEIGLGYTLNQWSGEAFQLFARAAVLMPSKDLGNLTAIGLDINPSYDLGIFRVFVDLGFAMAMDKDNLDFFFHVTPYLRKSIGIGDFYFGFNIWNGAARGGYEGLPWIQGSGKDGTGRINWSVPIFFEVSF